MYRPQPRSDESVQAAEQVTFTLLLPMLDLDFSDVASRSKFVVSAPARWQRRGGPVIIAAVDRMGLRLWSVGAEIGSSRSCHQAD